MIDRNERAEDEMISSKQQDDRHDSATAAGLLMAAANTINGKQHIRRNVSDVRLLGGNESNNYNERFSLTTCVDQSTNGRESVRQMSASDEPEKCDTREEMQASSGTPERVNGEIRTPPPPSLAKQQVLGQRKLQQQSDNDDSDGAFSQCASMRVRLKSSFQDIDQDDNSKSAKTFQVATARVTNGANDTNGRSNKPSLSNCDTSTKSARVARTTHHNQHQHHLANDHYHVLAREEDKKEVERVEDEANRKMEVATTDPRLNNDDEQNGTSSDSERRYRPQKYCAVCGDKAIACNFNAVTCESCKAFFRRNAFKEQRLRCLFENRCVIDRVTRRFCSKCRLLKCLRIGMKREWILTDEQKQIKRVKIMQNKQSRQQQQVSTTNAINGNIGLDEVTESRPSSGTSSSHGNQQQQQQPNEPLYSPASHQDRINRRQTVEMQDVATSCPDEADLLNGYILPYCSLAHQCQFCSFRLVPPSQQVIQPLPPPNFNHHYQQTGVGFHHHHQHQQQQHHQHQQQHQHQHQHQHQQHQQQQQQQQGTNQPHPPHHHYHYQQTNIQAGPVYNQQSQQQLMAGSAPATALANCYNFVPPSSATTGQLVIPQHVEPVTHHQYQYHHSRSPGRNLIGVGSMATGDASSSPSLGVTAHETALVSTSPECCCQTSHVQTVSQMARGSFHNLSAASQFTMDAATAVASGPQAMVGGCQPPVTVASGVPRLHMIELLQARVQPLNGSNESGAKLNVAVSGQSHPREVLVQNDKVVMAEVANVRQDALQSGADCSTVEGVDEEQEGLEEEDEEEVVVATEQDASNGRGGGSSSGGDQSAQTWNAVKNMGSNAAPTISEELSKDVAGEEETRLVLLADSNNTTIGCRGVQQSDTNWTHKVAAAVAASWPAKASNYINWKGELFFEPATNEQEILARVEQLDFSDTEKKLIYEMVEAAQLIFEQNERTPNDSMLDDIVFFCDLALRRLIKTVKKINAFKILGMDDQIVLLKNACFKILLIRSSLYYLDEFEGWVDKGGSMLPLKSLKTEKCHNYERHKELLDKLTPPLRRDRLIMSFLVMVILFDPTVALKHSNSVGLDNLIYLCTLRKYLVATQPEPLAKYERLVEVLQVTNACNEEYNLFFSRKYQPEQITPLLIEIFDISVNDSAR